MFWDLLHFYPPLGDYGFILFIFLVALPAYFVGRLLGRKIIIKKILTVVFVVAVFVMDIVYHYRIESYLGYFSNLILGSPSQLSKNPISKGSKTNSKKENRWSHDSK